MTSKEIFNQYFKKQFILWVSFWVVATAIRSLGGYKTSILLVLAMLLFFTLAALTIGYINYRFYEKSAPKIIAQLLDKDPLLSFQSAGFIKEEEDKLEGIINGYKVTLSPLTNIQNEKHLAILIPLQISERLDEYLTKYNENFRFRLLGELIFAEAILKDYDTEFNYDRISALLNKTTVSLKEDKIEPLPISNE